MRSRLEKLLFFLGLFGLFLSLATFGCGRRDNLGVSTHDLLSDQMSDLLASLDEFSGASGRFDIGRLNLLPAGWQDAQANSLSIRYVVIPSFFAQAKASSCLGLGFGDCAVDGGSGMKLTRTLSNCTIGSATLNGSIEFNFSGAACNLSATSEVATRKPNFEITGPAGARFQTTVTGTYGQRLTRTGMDTFTFESDGITRKLIAGTSTTLAHYTSRTDGALQIKGIFRDGRELTGGDIIIENVTAGSSCRFTPNAIKWTLLCNCPTSGSWSIACSDGTGGSLTHGSCGEGSFVLDGVTRTVKLPRCAGLSI